MVRVLLESLSLGDSLLSGVVVLADDVGVGVMGMRAKCRQPYVCRVCLTVIFACVGELAGLCQCMSVENKCKRRRCWSCFVRSLWVLYSIHLPIASTGTVSARSV